MGDGDEARRMALSAWTLRPYRHRGCRSGLRNDGATDALVLVGTTGTVPVHRDLTALERGPGFTQHVHRRTAVHTKGHSEAPQETESPTWTKSLAVQPATIPTHKNMNDVVAEKNKRVMSAMSTPYSGLLIFSPTLTQS